MVILSSPSGVGKTTITKKIQQKYHSLNFQSLTLQENQDQTKLTELIIILLQKEFKKSIEGNNFYEHAKIFDNYYGTEKIDEKL